MLARREIPDEYGWRNFGDIHADHEQLHYEGERPIVSHYNNQFDVVQGAIIQFLRSGDPNWYDLFDPLSRHVMDIDVYHTRQDRAAYNGGLFWFTDHYLDAATSTHRTYSRANRPRDGASYGGGPGTEHLFTTGLATYYYLTGNTDARDAVIELADWVVHSDDGEAWIGGLLDAGNTGRVTPWKGADAGPGRGAGNSINALLDAWLISGQSEYLEKAEQLIRRVVHPSDDVGRLSLLDVERNWSYTVCLASLAKYLQLLEDDTSRPMFGYVQAALLRYAEWMSRHERPYFDQADRLQYPTEAWAAQEFRKANVLRSASCYADEELRERLLRVGARLADRAWEDLLRFKSCRSARAAAVLLTEGVRDAEFRGPIVLSSRPISSTDDFDPPAEFRSQRTRILLQLKSVRGCAAMLSRAFSPRIWRRVRWSLR
ncbi:MAG: hypothetical protein JNL96_04080 [Planctomycetaceae bacterium]|nr:hypothetical protein [Planctomycetaceae bacterium]